MAKRVALDGRTALITGAASGIGRALAVAFSRRGTHLALADIDEAGLEETLRLARGSHGTTRITLHRLDVADRAAITALPSVIQDAHGGLDILVNNAGVALGGTFEQVDEADFDWLFEVNFFGVVRMTRAFLPMLRQSGEARIVNMSSVFGLIATPGQTAYTASKFAVRGFSESLRHELSGSRIGLTTVHPGGVATSIAWSARGPRGVPSHEIERQKRAFSAMLKLSPERAAEEILDAMERCRSRVIVGTDARVAATIERLIPVGYWSVLKRLNSRRGDQASAHG